MMKDHIRTCISAGVLYILSNWWYDRSEPVEILANDVCGDVEAFVDTIAVFMPLDDYDVDIMIADDGSTFDLTVKYQPVGDDDAYVIHFLATVTGNNGSVIASA